MLIGCWQEIQMIRGASLHVVDVLATFTPKMKNIKWRDVISLIIRVAELVRIPCCLLFFTHFDFYARLFSLFCTSDYQI
jgi:hypothetical protein